MSFIEGFKLKLTRTSTLERTALILEERILGSAIPDSGLDNVIQAIQTGRPISDYNYWNLENGKASVDKEDLPTLLAKRERLRKAYMRNTGELARRRRSILPWRISSIPVRSIEPLN